MDSPYLEGFIAKCAAHGVDPEEVIKFALLDEARYKAEDALTASGRSLTDLGTGVSRGLESAGDYISDKAQEAGNFVSRGTADVSTFIDRMADGRSGRTQGFLRSLSDLIDFSGDDEEEEEEIEEPTAYDEEPESKSAEHTHQLNSNEPNRSNTMEQVSNEYLEGFVAKCAEFNVNPEELVEFLKDAGIGRKARIGRKTRIGRKARSMRKDVKKRKAEKAKATKGMSGKTKAIIGGGATAGVGAATYAVHENNENNEKVAEAHKEYVEGFIAKCAEMNVDPNVVLATLQEA